VDCCKTPEAQYGVFITLDGISNDAWFLAFTRWSFSRRMAVGIEHCYPTARPPVHLLLPSADPVQHCWIFYVLRSGTVLLQAALGLAALGEEVAGPAIPLERIFEAANVILSYQNHDGGWATYENTRSFHAFEVPTSEPSARSESCCTTCFGPRQTWPHTGQTWPDAL
jgi:hypothetical protein